MLIIMAKAPIAGKAKTRLTPALGAIKAARLHASLVKFTLNKHLCSRVCPVQLCCSPDPRHVFFQSQKQPGIHLTTQSKGDLGLRMYFAMQQALSNARSIVLIGTDCPDLRPKQIAQGLQFLESGHDAVLGPADDGGYYLIGLNHPSLALFTDIAWGKSTVLKQTRQKLQALNWKWKELDCLRDIDRPADLNSGKYQRAMWKKI
jgi:rSAM/selenodomain-associated transferase 1